MDTTLGLLLICAAVSVAVGTGCETERGSREPTLTQRVHHSNTVFYGRVLGKWRDQRLSSGGHDAFVARTKVFCSLKGNQLMPVVNVSGLGDVMGQCHQAEVEVGGDYIMFGQGVDASNLLHYDMEPVTASAENMDLASAACGLGVSYPKGVDATTADWYCPSAADPEMCVPEEHPVAPQMQRGGGDDHKEDMPDHDHDHDGDGDHDHSDHDHDHDDGLDHDGDGDHDDDDHHVDEYHDHDGDGDHDHDDHNHDHSDHGHGHDHDHDGDHDDDDHHVNHDDHDHDHDHDDHDHDHDDHDHDHDDHDHDHDDHDHDHDHDDESTKSPNTGARQSALGLACFLLFFAAFFTRE